MTDVEVRVLLQTSSAIVQMSTEQFDETALSNSQLSQKSDNNLASYYLVSQVTLRYEATSYSRFARFGICRTDTSDKSAISQKDGR